MEKKKVIMYSDERGYTLIKEKKPTAKLKDLDFLKSIAGKVGPIMNDLKNIDVEQLEKIYHINISLY